MKLKRSIILAILALCIGVTGCHRDTEKDTLAVKQTIMRYNQLLAVGYTSMNMNPLQEVATIEQATKEYYQMAALGEAKVRMETQLKNMEFTSITFSGKSAATVNTEEIWDYQHVDIKTQQVVQIQKNILYKLQYELEKKGDKWFITSVTTIGEKMRSQHQQSAK